MNWDDHSDFLRKRVNSLIQTDRDSPIWTTGDFCVVDIEVTGLGEQGRIVEVGAIRANRGVVTTFHRLVNPGIDIPEEASAVHQITNDMVEMAPAMSEISASLREFIGSATPMAFNAASDAQMLNHHIGWETPAGGPMTGNWVCALRAARHLWPLAPGFSNQVLRHFFRHRPSELLDGSIELKDGGLVDLIQKDPRQLVAHSALPDALVTLMTLRRAFADAFDRHGIADIAKLKAFTDKPITVCLMPFGPHAGQPIEQVPSKSLEWVLLKIRTLDWDLRLTIERVLSARSGGRSGGHSGFVFGARPAKTLSAMR